MRAGHAQYGYGDNRVHDEGDGEYGENYDRFCHRHHGENELEQAVVTSIATMGIIGATPPQSQWYVIKTEDASGAMEAKK